MASLGEKHVQTRIESYFNVSYNQQHKSGVVRSKRLQEALNAVTGSNEEHIE